MRWEICKGCRAIFSCHIHSKLPLSYGDDKDKYKDKDEDKTKTMKKTKQIPRQIQGAKGGLRAEGSLQGDTAATAHKCSWWWRWQRQRRWQRQWQRQRQTKRQTQTQREKGGLQAGACKELLLMLLHKNALVPTNTSCSYLSRTLSIHCHPDFQNRIVRWPMVLIVGCVMKPFANCHLTNITGSNSDSIWPSISTTTWWSTSLTTNCFPQVHKLQINLLALKVALYLKSYLIPTQGKIVWLYSYKKCEFERPSEPWFLIWQWQYPWYCTKSFSTFYFSSFIFDTQNRNNFVKS